MQDINIFAFADEAASDIDTQIAVMKSNGLDGLEIRNVDGSNVSDITLEKAKEIKQKMDDAGLKIWSIGSPIGKIDIEKDDFSGHMDKFKHTLEVAEILNADCFRLFSFYLPRGKNPADYKAEVIHRMGSFCEAAKGHKVILCHENEKGIYGDTAERCLEIHKALPEIAGIFDPANYVQCEVDTLKAWNILKSHIKYMHIKDAGKEGHVVPAGEGMGNVPAIVRDFVAGGGSAFTIEPHLTVFDGFAGLEKRAQSCPDKFVYESRLAAFDVACQAFRKIVSSII